MKELNGCGSGVAIHCTTEELANKVLKIAHEAGYRWSSGDSLNYFTKYSNYKDKTCYVLNGDVAYCSNTYAEKENYKIISAEEFIKLNSLKREDVAEESYTITRKALSEVYPLIYGCSKWRKIVEAILNTNLFAEEFPISKERVLEAYSEANPKQLEWLNKYLPKPKVVKVVEVDRWLLADKSGDIYNYSFMSKSLAEDYAKSNRTFIYPVNLTGTFEIEE